MKRGGLAFTCAALLAVAGCASLEPPLPVADPGIAADWPLPEATPGAAERDHAQAATGSSGAAGVGAAQGARGTGAQPTDAPGAALPPAASDIGWRDFFADARLRELVDRSLKNNRDLRGATLAVERARALYRIQRAEQLPALDAAASASRAGGSRLGAIEAYRADIGLAAFELDLFGRVRNLSRSALQQYFSQEQARRSVQLSLIAEVANAWLTLAADRELLRVAQATLENQQVSFRLTEQRHALGAVSALDLAQASTTVETARVDAARFNGRVAQDRNALTLLVGAPIEPALLPERLDDGVSGIGPLPAGMPSEVLLRRPDVMQAEHALRAANANIGAARAAFFPSITLTGTVGTASRELSGLFGSGSFGWTFLPQVRIPIFQGGALRAGLRAAETERDIALAQYERSIQAGFREVSDALALARTLVEQREAQQALLQSAARANDLSKARYEAGRDSFLFLLDAQRTLYAAQQQLIATRLAEQSNRVTLYRVLGGGWKEVER